MSDQIHNTVLRVYDTVADETLWPSVLQDFADQIGAVGCIIFGWKLRGQQRELLAKTASAFYDPAVLNTYISKCADDETRDQDIFESHSLRHDRIDLIQDDVLASSTEELKRLPNVQKLLKFGILHRAAGLLNKDNCMTSRFSVQLSEARGRLSPADHAHMAAILPHIAKALDLGRPTRQLVAKHQSLLAAMDHLSIGVCILDARGNVVIENEELRRQMEHHDVFSVDVTGRFFLSTPQGQKQLETLKEHAFNHGHFGARPRKEAIPTGGDGFLCIELVPLNQSAEIGSKTFGGYVLYSTETSQPFQCNTQPIQTAFGLTDTELQLIDQIAKGLTNTQIAERRDRSVATINAQVKSILSKTQCTTRTQFVRLMMSFGTDFCDITP